jgi:hypothetical protein
MLINKILMFVTSILLKLVTIYPLNNIDDGHQFRFTAAPNSVFYTFNSALEP